jgi:hypothetical protein
MKTRSSCLTSSWGIPSSSLLLSNISFNQLRDVDGKLKEVETGGQGPTILAMLGLRVVLHNIKRKLLFLIKK